MCSVRANAGTEETSRLVSLVSGCEMKKNNVGEQEGDDTHHGEWAQKLKKKWQVEKEMRHTKLSAGSPRSIFKPDNFWVTQAPLTTQNSCAASSANHFSMHEPCVNYAMSDGCSDKERSNSDDDKMEIYERGGDDALAQALADASVSEPLCVSSLLVPPSVGADKTNIELSENQFDIFEHFFNKDHSSYYGRHVEQQIANRNENDYARMLFQFDFEIVTDSLNRECFRFEVEEVNAQQKTKDSATHHDRNRTALRKWAET